MVIRVKKSFYMILEVILRLVIVPSLRSFLLRILGASIGKNVRIYEIRMINLSSGFKNLTIGDDVHIGTGCLIDLEGKVVIENGATLSPRVMILTHSDPGSLHNSPLCIGFKPFVADVRVGAYCWLGANATVLAGSRICDKTILGACSLAKGVLDSKCIYAGVPAKKIKTLEWL